MNGVASTGNSEAVLRFFVLKEKSSADMMRGFMFSERV
jgi:hypothetical protein